MKKSELHPNPSLAIPTIPVVCDRCRAEGTAGDPMFAGVQDILNFEPVPRRAQVNSWTAEHQRAFIAALAITGSAKKAAATIGRHAYGADQLRKGRGGRGFADAWEAALEIAREREMARVYENLAELRESDEAANARADTAPTFDSDEHWDGDGPNSYDEAQDAIRERLLNCRRLLLMALSDEPEKRAAWEVLCGPVDWEKARKLEAQDNEPFGMPSMRKEDMIMTAEAGLMHEFAGEGRDLKGELQQAVAEYRETGSLDGPKVRRLCD